MSPATKSSPILPRPHWIRGTGRVRLVGDGEATIALTGGARVSLRVAPGVQFAFEGESVRRMPAPDRILFADAKGTLVVTGHGIELEVERGSLVAGIVGRFDVVLDGCGELVTAAGARCGWGLGLHPKTFSIDGSKCVEALPPPGVAA